MRVRLLAVAAALAFAAPAAATAPRVEARAWLVQNGATGEVLLRQNASARLPIASITKLMTVLVALDRSRPREMVTVAPVAVGVGGSTLNLRVGERIPLIDLVEGALVQSANDAAFALAAHVGRGSVERFVRLMNRNARLLGLRDTHFVRPDGLDVAGHLSSARDVTLLGRLAMRNPTIRSIVRRRDDVAAGRRLHTWNDLLASFPGTVGVKTGHTSAAGWSQVAAVRAPGFTMYATILGSPTREQRNTDLAELLAWGISRYRVATVVSATRVYAAVVAPYGRDAVPLRAERPLTRVIRLGRPVVERVVVPRSVTLPVRQGERLGEVRIYARGRLLGTRPLVASRAVAEPSLVGRIGWYAGESLRNAWGLIR